MEKETTSVIFYRSWWKLANTLDDQKRLALFDAILNYAFDEVVPEDDFTKMGTYQMRDQLDRDREKYERQRKQRKEAIKKRWENYNAVMANKDAAERIQANTNEYERIRPNTDEYETIRGNSLNENDNSNCNSNDNGNSNCNSNDNENYNGRDKSLSLKKNNIARGGAPERERKNKGADFEPPTAAEVAAYAAENGYAVDAEYFVDFHNGNGWKVGKNAINDWRAALRTWVKKGAEMRRASGRSITEEKKGPGPEQRKKFSRTL